MKTEIFIEGVQADLTAGISALITKSVNDVREINTKNGSYTKTIKLPGTARNNRIFGHILNPTRTGDYNPSLANVNQNFSAALPAKCAIYSDGLMVVQGTLRILKINDYGKNMYDYECTVYGVLGGFAGALSTAGDISDLDFGDYDAFWNASNMALWNIPNAGEGIYFPLIDYGNVSTDKINYDFKARRPALFVKEIMEKIIAVNGYKADCSLFSEDSFKRLIVPHNEDVVNQITTRLLHRTTSSHLVASSSFPIATKVLLVNHIAAANFTTSVTNDEFTYTGSSATQVSIFFGVGGTVNIIGGGGPGLPLPHTLWLKIVVGSVEQFYYLPFEGGGYEFSDTVQIVVNPGDVVYFQVGASGAPGGVWTVQANFGWVIIDADAQQVSPANYGDVLRINNLIPKGVKQKDFFISVMQMFNLHIVDDDMDERMLIIRPYTSFYGAGGTVDWSRKLNHAMPKTYTPMSELAGQRLYFRYTEDNDYWNELYRKRHTSNYGNRSVQTGFAFGESEKEVKLIFAATPIVRWVGVDKAVSTIRGGDDVEEKSISSKIRILYARTLTGVASWDLTNGSTVLATYTSYPYAGHLDHPNSPTKDLNWGPPREVFYGLTTPYPDNNLYTSYWQHYINEITHKASLLLTCYMRLSRLDFSNLDFSKYIFIDGNLWLLNQVIDYDTENEGLTKVELLKLINPL
jgi:hypothetical protein